VVRSNASITEVRRHELIDHTERVSGSTSGRLNGLERPVTIAFRSTFTTSQKETPMPDFEMTDLIERLQQSNRRWRRLALGLLAALGLAVLLLMSSATVLLVRVERERRQAEAAAEQARQQQQKAREAVEEFQQKGRQP
jgi:hypothetical protein